MNIVKLGDMIKYIGSPYHVMDVVNMTVDKKYKIIKYSKGAILVKNDINVLDFVYRSHFDFKLLARENNINSILL